MTARHDLDRTLDAWFHGSATAAPPAEPLTQAIESTRRVRPRIAPVAWVGSSWVDSDEADGLRSAIAGLRPALVIAFAVLLLLAFVGGALLVGSRLVPHPFKPAPFSEYRNGVIAFSKDGDIVVADRPGGDLRPLVTGPEDDSGPMFSPDGTKLAFVRATEQGPALMLANADGTNVVQVASEPIQDEYLSFSPDGRFLVGTGQEESLDGADSTYRIVVHPVDPPAAPIVLGIHLHDSPEVVWEEGGLEFRPTNSQEILVVGTLEADGPRGIYVYDLATGAIRTVAEPAGCCGDVKWSANGEHISYFLNGTHVIAADGSGDRRLDDGFSISPWSNDGTRIVIARPREDGGRQPVVVSTSGDGEPVVLACSALTDIECPELWFWSPDDSTLIGTGFSTEDGSSTDDGPLQIPLKADPDTGAVTELGWDVDLNDAQQWQRVAP